MNDDYLSLDKSVEYLNLSRQNQVKHMTECLLQDVLSGRVPVYGRYFPRGAKWRIGRLIARTDSEAQANSGRESSAKPIDHVDSPLLNRRIVERERQFLAYSTKVLDYSDDEIEGFLKTELAPSTTHDQQPNPTISREEATQRVREFVAVGVEAVEYEAINDPVQLCVAGAVADHIEARIRKQQTSPVDVVVAMLDDGKGAVLYDNKKPCRGWPHGARLVFRRADLDGLAGVEKPQEQLKPKSSGAAKGGRARAAIYSGAREVCRSYAREMRAGLSAGDKPTLDDCADAIDKDRENIEAEHHINLAKRSTIRRYLNNLDD